MPTISISVILSSQFRSGRPANCDRRRERERATFEIPGARDMILAGIGACFVLYVVTEIARDLGSAGIVRVQRCSWLHTDMTVSNCAVVRLPSGDE